MNYKTLNKVLFLAGVLLLLVVAFFTLPKLIADEMFPVPLDILQTVEECKGELGLTDVDSALVLSIMKQESVSNLLLVLMRGHRGLCKLCLPPLLV